MLFPTLPFPPGELISHFHRPEISFPLVYLHQQLNKGYLLLRPPAIAPFVSMTIWATNTGLMKATSVLAALPVDLETKLLGESAASWTAVVAVVAVAEVRHQGWCLGLSIPLPVDISQNPTLPEARQSPPQLTLPTDAITF